MKYKLIHLFSLEVIDYNDCDKFEDMPRLGTSINSTNKGPVCVIMRVSIPNNEYHFYVLPILEQLQAEAKGDYKLEINSI